MKPSTEYCFHPFIIRLTTVSYPYKTFEHKNVIVEQFMNREKACEIILESMRLYQAEKEMLMQLQ